MSKIKIVLYLQQIPFLPVQVILNFSSILLEDLEQRVWICKEQVNSCITTLIFIIVTFEKLQGQVIGDKNQPHKEGYDGRID